MRDFDFLEPSSLADASRMLAQHGEECRVVAGGTALVLVMRQRMVAPSHLVSIARIAALRGISFEEGKGLRIGALTVHAEIARSTIVRQHYPMLADMAAELANPQVRNQATIGGNLCYADPATDPPSCLMALDARVVLGSELGERVLTMQEFLVDYFTTALQPDEIVSEIRIPPPSFTAGRHVRFLRTAADHRPLVNVAVTIRQKGPTCDDAKVVVGASTPIPTRMAGCEAFLRGKKMTLDVAAEAARIGAEEITPISDGRGSEEYRRAMIQVVTRRTLAGLFGLAPGAEAP